MYNGNEVLETVDLRSFEKVTPDSPAGGVYDVMEITPYKTSCRLRLPEIITDGLEAENIEIRINKPGNIIVMLPGSEEEFEVHRKTGAKVGAIHSAKLARILENKKVELPAKYRVTKDDRLGGWVCKRME